MRARKLRLSIPSAVALALASACGSAEPSVATLTSAVSASAVDPGNAGGNKYLTVMTRNLYLGADIFTPFTAEDPLAAAAEVWAEIQASDFPSRAKGIADEIAATRPDVVGLQEVFRFVATPLGATSPVVLDLDFLSLLVAELHARGLDYRVAALEDHIDLTVPFEAMGVQIRMVDHDAILVDRDVQILGSGGGDFLARFETSLGGVIPVTVLRGWTDVRLRHQGVELTFVNAHAETFELGSGALTHAQVTELVARFGAFEPLVVVGDFNSDANAADTEGTAYEVLSTAWEDVWTALDLGPGLTCCFAPDLVTLQELYERIDLVLVDGAVTPVSAERVGLAPVLRGDRWPSDHAGVVATLRLENPRFFELVP